jgi:small subunit ribosomal protein S20
MANIKSAKKRAITNAKRNLRNTARRSEIKTITRKVIDALDSNDLDKAKLELKVAISKIARAKGKGVFKKNTASRKISRITKKVTSAEKGVSTK